MFDTLIATIAAPCLEGVYLAGEQHANFAGFSFALVAVFCAGLIGRFSK